MHTIPALQVAARLTVALCLLASVRAAVEDVYSWPDVDWSDLKPFHDFKHNHDYYYQVPKNPRGAVFLAHGCVHSAYNYWPQSEDCEECRGLPEELSHTLQALRLGFAVIAVSSLDRETGCWSYWDDIFDVADIIADWRDEWGLDHLPIYGCGISSGGSFVLKLPRYMKFDGVMSEALGIDPQSGGYRDIPGVYPPAVIVSMQRDTKQRALIQENKDILLARNTPAEIIKSYPRRVYPTYFSERYPLYISEELSRSVHDGLLAIEMIDAEGNVLEDPRYTDRPWLKLLSAAVPEVTGQTENFQGRTVPRFPETSEDVRLPGVYELMNLAFNLHEIISDYFTPSLLWLESGAKADIQSLVDQYTWGWPPPPSPSARPIQKPAPRPKKPKPASEGSLKVQSHTENATIPAPITTPAPVTTPTPIPMQTGAASAPVTVQPQMDTKSAATVDGTPAADPAATASSTPTQIPDTASTPAATPDAPASATDSSGGSSNVAAIVGGAVGGALGTILIVGLLWWWLRRRRAAREAAPILTTFNSAYVGPGAATAQVSIAPFGLKEKFELTEVVEQTGSPSSARRRMRTAFQGSPRKHVSPRKPGAA